MLEKNWAVAIIAAMSCACFNILTILEGLDDEYEHMGIYGLGSGVMFAVTKAYWPGEDKEEEDLY